jgi:hypothetical protein
MDELLDSLRSFKNGEMLISYNESGKGFELTASCGKFSKTAFLADSPKLDKGDCATVMALRTIRQVREAVNLNRNVKRADAGELPEA